MGEIRVRLGQGPEAEAACRRASSLVEPLAEGTEDASKYREELAAAQSNLGSIYHRAERTAEAEAAYRRATEILGPLAEEGSRLHSQHLLCITLGGLAKLSNQTGRPAEAEAAWGRAAPIPESLILKHPAGDKYRLCLAQHRIGVGYFHENDGQPGRSEAEAACR